MFRLKKPNKKPAVKNSGLLTPIQLERYAKVMVWAMREARMESGPGMKFSPGDVVVLRYDPLAGPLAELIYADLLDQGLIVSLKPNAHFGMEKIYFDHAQDDQLKFVGPWARELYKDMNGLISLRAPESLTHLKDCDPKKMALATKSMKSLRKITNKREARGLFGWTLCQLPTAVLADQAQMSLAEYTKEVVKACYLDEADPVARWQKSMGKIDEIKKTLTDMPIEYVHVESEDGETDLKVWIGEQRRWLGGSGHNIPSFEVFISPEAGRAEGKYHANEASFKMGRYVRDVRLEFRDGKVIRATACAEEEFVRSRVNLDEGSKMLGEFSLTDRRFSEITRFMASTLYDENVGGANGNCHIAIGNAYEDSYAHSVEKALTAAMAKKLKFNKSSEHWDLVTTTPRTVTAYLKGGGKVVIYRNGQFTC